MVSLNTQPLSSQTSKLVHLQLMYSELRMPNLPAVAAVPNPPQPLTSGFPGLGFWDLFLGGHGSSPSHSLPCWSGQNSQRAVPSRFLFRHCTHTHSHQTFLMFQCLGKDLTRHPDSSAPTLIPLHLIMNLAGHITGISFRAPDFSPLPVL